MSYVIKHLGIYLVFLLKYSSKSSPHKHRTNETFSVLPGFCTIMGRRFVMNEVEADLLTASFSAHS